jgi:hypothetical protein
MHHLDQYEPWTGKAVVPTDVLKQPPIQMLTTQNVAHLFTERLEALRVRGDHCELTTGFHLDGKEEARMKSNGPG